MVQTPLQAAYLNSQRLRGAVLLAEDGRFYYIGCGSCIVRADNSWCRTRGNTVFCLLCLSFETTGAVLDANVKRPGFD